MKKNLLVFLLGMAPFAGHAEVISERMAEATAARFFYGENARFSRSANLPLQLVWKGQSKTSRSASTDAPAFYVFNRGNQQGFVIVAGDDAVKPILGYANEGSFGVENMPENLKGWMNGIQEDIQAVRSQSVEATADVKQAWEALAASQVLVDLKTPKWNQQAPYNWNCPVVRFSDGDWHAYVGCTMTATGIVMGYHQWPIHGDGVLSRFYAQNIGAWMEEVNLSERTYDWNNMPYINGNQLPSYSKDEEYLKDPEALRQGNAVSPLLADLGQMVRANYKYTGTTGDMELMAIRLTQHMKYDESTAYVQRKFFSKDVWCSLLKEELDSNRPIVFAGYGMQGMGGHAFVLEGYDSNGLFLVNWGWGGMSDGFFDIDVMHPSQQGAGGSQGGFHLDQEAIMRMRPMRPGETLASTEEILFVLGSIGGSPAQPGLHVLEENVKFEKGSSFTVSAGAIFNWGTARYDGKMKLVLTDARGQVKEELRTSLGTPSLGTGNVTMPFWDERDKVTVTLNQNIVTGDRIRLLHQSKNGAWKVVTTKETDIPWEIELKKADVAPVALDVKTTAGVNLNGRAVATFSAPTATTPSDPSVEAFYAEQKDAETIVLKKIEPQGDKLIIPANVGVVLATQGEMKFNMSTVTENAVYVPETNLLRSTTAQGTTVDHTVNAYILGKKNDNVLFHVLSDSHRNIAANRAYLELPTSMNAYSVKMVFDGEATGIEQHIVEDHPNAPIYDLSGRQVMHPEKGGIYIQNGKKFIVK